MANGHSPILELHYTRCIDSFKSQCNYPRPGGAATFSILLEICSNKCHPFLASGSNGTDAADALFYIFGMT